MAESGYDGLVHDLSGLLESARRASARAVNSVMTATYWEIGRRIVEYEQGGKERAEYGARLLERLGADLSGRFGRGFSSDNLERMRRFYEAFPDSGISETLSRKSRIESSAKRFPLPWSSYVVLIRKTRSPEQLAFYHDQACRNVWSVRQLRRQIASQFYERSARSSKTATVPEPRGISRPGDAVTPDEEVRDPLVLEFLGLKDEYSESDLEEALIRHLESFLMELGDEFTFVGRQRRLRIGDTYYRVDLLLFHRRLRCLVVIDLKVGRFSSADAGQMHTYLEYAREHWVQAGENPPVGLILCSEGDDALARYALAGLRNKVLAREYRLALPEEARLREEIQRTRRRLEARAPGPGSS